ncbi:amino acid permease, partial [Escherichia coli]|uniref:amino acid permease n=2 Tax=Pseudomonadota TaxID=1224 RepID=UPI003D36C7D5
RNVVRATLFGLGLTGLLYIAVCSGIIFALPTAEVANAQAPFALFVERFWGHRAGLATAAFAAIAAIGALNGWTLLQGEVPLGMARAGLLPRWVGRT